MLEYPIDDAAALLEKNLKTATTSIEEIERDVDFITDQCTTIEVGILISTICLYVCLFIYLFFIDESTKTFQDVYLLKNNISSTECFIYSSVK